jgi:CRISPR/Cas system endoribonuclease Cas6 (RAMP superfamily)
MWLRICVLAILMGGYASGYTQQVPVQQVKGFVVDRALQRPLRGATVVLEGASPIQVLTDSNGYFIIRSIPVGRYALRITHVGFLPAVQNLVLEAGKELGLQVELEDDVAASKEIVVRSKVNNGCLV